MAKTISFMVMAATMAMLSLVAVAYGQPITPDPDPQRGGCEPTSCPDVRHFYLFCNGEGKIFSMCAHDPNHPLDGIDPDDLDMLTSSRYFDGAGWTIHPVKMPSAPICLQFAGNGPNVMDGNVCSEHNGCTIGQVYKKSDFVNDMTRAVNEWNCICGLADAPCACPVKIMWTNDPDVFQDPTGRRQPEGVADGSIDPATNDLERIVSKGFSGAANYDASQNILDGNCEIDCSKMTIYMNYTASFTGRLSDADPYSPRFTYISSSFTDANWNLAGRGPFDATNSINLVHGIRYAIARLVNATGSRGDHNRYAPKGKGADCFLLDNSQTLAQTSSSAEETKPIPDEEKCMFHALYCPNYSSSVGESASAGALGWIGVMPNPSRNLAVVTFTPSRSMRAFDITVSDPGGREVYGHHFREELSGAMRVTLDVASWAVGTYYVTVKAGNAYRQTIPIQVIR